MEEEINRVFKEKVFVVKNFEKEKVPLGEFAVLFEGKCLFSKRETGRWPKVEEIIKKLEKKMSKGQEPHKHHVRKPHESGNRNQEEDGLIGGDEEN